MALSIESTGLYTSERHAEAKEEGKLTAGEAAKLLSKKLKQKISAKELVEAHTVIYGREPEWHHSGFYKAAGMRKKTMGRTFFFEVDELDVLAGQWGLLETKREHRKAVEEHAKLEKLNFLKSIVGGYKAEAAAKGYKEGWVYYKLKEYCDDYQLLKEALK